MNGDRLCLETKRRMQNEDQVQTRKKDKKKAIHQDCLYTCMPLSIFLSYSAAI